MANQKRQERKTDMSIEEEAAMPGDEVIEPIEEVAAEPRGGAAEPLAEVLKRLESAYAAYTEAEREVAKAYKSNETQVEKAYKEAERKANNAFEKAVEQAIKARDEAEQQALRGGNRPCSRLRGITRGQRSKPRSLTRRL